MAAESAPSGGVADSGLPDALATPGRASASSRGSAASRHSGQVHVDPALAALAVPGTRFLRMVQQASSRRRWQRRALVTTVKEILLLTPDSKRRVTRLVLPSEVREMVVHAVAGGLQVMLVCAEPEPDLLVRFFVDTAEAEKAVRDFRDCLRSAAEAAGADEIPVRRGYGDLLMSARLGKGADWQGPRCKMQALASNPIPPPPPDPNEELDRRRELLSERAETLQERAESVAARQQELDRAQEQVDEDERLRRKEAEFLHLLSLPRRRSLQHLGPPPSGDRVYWGQSWASMRPQEGEPRGAPDGERAGRTLPEADAVRQHSLPGAPLAPPPYFASETWERFVRQWEQRAERRCRSI
eukprot:TRINITY_DN47845_c0_g1_i1.p1 TRINITY_DN47845_c0_g1~~TRINITY_DN47845_c0_g1_i1.p1  ORF type:complete len:356 (+),score=84.68 TRINITY_DN47845_c0_g1_i1:84-1151(+)